MDPRLKQSIMVMLNGFPQTNQDYQIFLATLAKLCDGVAPEAVTGACRRFSDGLVEGQSLDYAPSTARFMDEVRRLDAIEQAKRKPRLGYAGYQRGKLAPFEIAIEKAAADMAAQGRALLDDNATLDEFKSKARSGQIPFGSTWRLGKIYGPATIATRQASLDMPKIGQEGGQDEL